MERIYDVCIIGSGPAGLFAADRLSRGGMKCCIIEKTSFCSGGLFNDGKLNLSTKIGMELDKLKLSEEKAREYLKYIDEMFLRLGADKKVYGSDRESVKHWVKKALKHKVRLVPSLQRHIGTDRAKEVIEKFRSHLIEEGVEFYLNTEVEEILHKMTKESNFELKTDKGKFKSKTLLSCPGRAGAYWFREQSKKLGVKNVFGSIDVGCRIEMPNGVYDEITDIIYDPKFRYVTHCHGDEVRTFCTNKGGRIRVEKFVSDGSELQLVNGDGLKDNKTDNTNIAILCTVSLTNPSVDTTELGRNIALETLRAGNGVPIVQRVGDFMRGRRSKVETFDKSIYSRLKSTLSIPKQAYPGDITHVYRARVIDNIREFLEVMNQIFPGFMSPENLLYIPEIKFYDTDYITNENLETNIEDLFVAGDGCGKSRGIVGAAVTGIMAAEGILKKK